MPDPSGRTGLGAAPGPHPGSATARLWLGGVGGGPSCSLGLLPQGVWTGRQGPQPGECTVITPPTGSGPRDGKCTSQGRPAESAAEPRMGGRRDCWAGGGAGLGAGRGRPRLARSPCAHHLNCFRKMLRFRLFLESRKVIWNARSRESGTRRRHGAPPPSEPPAPAQPHLLGLLPGGGSCGLLGLRHGEGEEPLDAGEVRLHHLGAQAVQRRPHGAALCG